MSHCPEDMMPISAVVSRFDHLMAWREIFNLTIDVIDTVNDIVCTRTDGNSINDFCCFSSPYPIDEIIMSHETGTFTYQNLFSANKVNTFYQRYVHLGGSTFIHCSRTTVVQVHRNIFVSNSHS